MKLRIISSIFLILLTLLLIFNLIGAYILISIVAIFGIFELASLIKNKFKYLIYFSMLTYLFSLILFNNYNILIIISTIIFLLLLTIIFEEIHLNDVLLIFIFTTIITFAMISFLKMYSYQNLPYPTIYLVLFPIIINFINDSGAYIFGSLFGKHKLNKRISPNKTIEGSIGGILSSIIATLIILFIIYGFNLTILINYSYHLIVLSIVIAITAQFGDLVFSLIKRNYNIKDFGNLIPGHGGILDRFDSLIFVFFILYIFNNGI